MGRIAALGAILRNTEVNKGAIGGKTTQREQKRSITTTLSFLQ